MNGALLAHDERPPLNNKNEILFYTVVTTSVAFQQELRASASPR